MPIVSGGGAGAAYTPPVTRAQYSGNAVNIANGASGVLTWDTKNSGTSLLDLTVPSQPAIVTAGVYAVTVRFVGNALTVAGAYDATLDMDANGEDPQIGARSGVAVAGHTTVGLILAMTYYVPAGGVLQAQIVSSLDGAAARDFTLNLAVVQRLS